MIQNIGSLVFICSARKHTIADFRLPIANCRCRRSSNRQSAIGNRQCLSSLSRRSSERLRCGPTFQSCASLPGKPSCRRRLPPPRFRSDGRGFACCLGHFANFLSRLRIKFRSAAREWLRSTRRRGRPVAAPLRANGRCLCALRRRCRRAVRGPILGQKAGPELRQCRRQ